MSGLSSVSRGVIRAINDGECYSLSIPPVSGGVSRTLLTQANQALAFLQGIVVRRLGAGQERTAFECVYTQKDGLLGRIAVYVPNFEPFLQQAKSRPDVDLLPGIESALRRRADTAQALLKNKSLVTYAGLGPLLPIEDAKSPLIHSLGQALESDPVQRGVLAEWLEKFHIPVMGHLETTTECLETAALRPNYRTWDQNRDLQNPNWLAAMDYLKCTLEGLDLLHRNRFIHRDPTRGNTVKTMWRAGHLADFGTCTKANSQVYFSGADGVSRAIPEAERTAPTQQTDLLHAAITATQVLFGTVIPTPAGERCWILTHQHAKKACSDYLAAFPSEQTSHGTGKIVCTLQQMLNDAPQDRGDASSLLNSVSNLEVVRETLALFIGRHVRIAQEISLGNKSPGAPVYLPELKEALDRVSRRLLGSYQDGVLGGKVIGGVSAQDVLTIMYTMPAHAKQADALPAFAHYIGEFVSSPQLDPVPIANASWAMRELSSFRGHTQEHAALGEIYRRILSQTRGGLDPQHLLNLYANSTPLDGLHTAKLVDALIEAKYLNYKTMPEHVLRARCELLAAQNAPEFKDATFSTMIKGGVTNKQYLFVAWADALKEIQNPLARNRIAVALWEGEMFEKNIFSTDQRMTFNEWIDIVQHYSGQQVKAA